MAISHVTKITERHFGRITDDYMFISPLQADCVLNGFIFPASLCIFVFVRDKVTDIRKTITATQPAKLRYIWLRATCSRVMTTLRRLESKWCGVVVVWADSKVSTTYSRLFATVRSFLGSWAVRGDLARNLREEVEL